MLTAGLLFWLSANQIATSDYNWGLLLWVGAITLYVLSIAPWQKPVASWHWPRRLSFLAIGSILLLAIAARFWQLGSIPETLGGDEGSQGIEALRVLDGTIRNPFSTGWLGVPTMSFYYNALTIGPLGNTILALRLPWALVGVLSVICTFLLVRRLLSLTLALTTAVLLACYHYHIHYSRLGSNQIADTLFVALALWLLYRGYDTGNWRDWALCGVVVGMAQYFMLVRVLRASW